MAKKKKAQQKKVGRGGKEDQATTEQSDKSENKKSKKEPPSEHSWEGAYLDEKHKPGCVNRHVKWYAESNTCSHRGQARKRAQEDSAAYLSGKTSLKPGEKDEWDPNTAGNYARSGSKPFKHEAHHIVAAAELKGAIIEASSGIEPEDQILLMMRGGLLSEEYNINDQVNMIILPMELDPARKLGLPIHRTIPAHPDYSTYIGDELMKKLAWLQEAADKHEVPPYQSSKEKIEALSNTMYPKIKFAGSKLKSLKSNDVEQFTLDAVTSSIKTS